MSKIRRSFTPEDRYSIVQEAIRDGYSETCRKYNLSPSLLRKWRLKYLSKGKEGLKDSYSRVDPQLRALEEENERLKRIVAKQALELEIKSELLKKTPARRPLFNPGEASIHETVRKSGKSYPVISMAQPATERVLLPTPVRQTWGKT
jgi:transposase-like protein